MTADATDPMQEFLLGLASTIDQLAAVVGGRPGAAASVAGWPVSDLAADFGTLITDVSEILARVLTAFIAILEAIVEMLRATPTAGSAPTSDFHSIPVHIAPVSG